MKILIAGVGGVGGYFGGFLAKHYYKNKQVEICFFARGEHLKKIQQHGLKIIHGNQEFIAFPSLVTDNATDIGIVDILIICTKSFDLENTLDQLKPCINTNSIILPLLNGVDSRKRIQKLLPVNLILDGCVYIVSRLKQPGIIENSGNIQKLFFGLDQFTNAKLEQLENLFKQANIEATHSQNISSIIWEKYIFISATATATSYYNNCIGELLKDAEKINTIQRLIEEVKQLAQARGISVTADIVEKNLLRLKSLPFDSTSSMHSDFQNKKKQNELESLTGFVIRESQKLQLLTPTYEMAHTSLKIKSGI